ncbi:MAG TPA: hypothetical protein VF755_15000 [Catenuloplanes sp.]|jgi:hypothetical protein
MTEQTKTTRIPAPVYAAAGVGDLAYRQLRKLPTVVGDLSGRAVASGFELRERAVASLKVANSTAGVLKEKATTTDIEQLRTAARRNKEALAQAAQTAQERAAAVYITLVAHGERVVGTGVVQAADTVNSDMEATPAPAEVTATPADVADKKATAAKRTRPAAK